MGSTLNSLITAITGGVVTINGTVAQLTRLTYQQEYINNINTAQFVPILYFNTQTGSVNISNTNVLSILYTDITTAGDWVCLNQTN